MLIGKSNINKILILHKNKHWTLFIVIISLLLLLIDRILLMY